MSIVRRLLAPVLVLLAVAPLAAGAQERALMLDLRGGMAVPVGSFADGVRTGEGTTAGPTLGAAFVLRRSDRRTVYAGFNQHRFGCVDAGCAEGGRYVATGFDVGMRLALLPGRTFVPWIRLGAITTRVETADLPSPDAGVSDLGFGGEAGVGVYIGPNSTVALNPAVTLSAVNSELPGGTTLRLRYLTATLALVLAF